jgi:hypothetical protein
MKISKAAVMGFVATHNVPRAGAKFVPEILSTMDEKEDSNSNKNHALSHTLKKRHQERHLLLDEIVEDKVDEKTTADTGILISQGQDDGTPCKYLDGSPGVKCVGVNACKGVTIAEIGCGGCLGTKSCYNAGTATIGEDSCGGYKACYDVMNSKIYDHSCLGDYACFQAQRNIIHDDSCIGKQVCLRLVNSTVGTFSCIGDSACNVAPVEFCGFFCSQVILPHTTNVGNDSCFGTKSCYFIFDVPAYSAEIASGKKFAN